MKYRTKLKYIDAIKLPEKDETPTEEFLEELHSFLEGLPWESGRDGSIIVHDDCGKPFEYFPGSYVLKDEEWGELYTIDPEYFEDTYEKVK